MTPDHVNPEAPWPHLRVLEACHQGRRQGARSSAWRSIRPIARDTAALARSCAAQAGARPRRCRRHAARRRLVPGTCRAVAGARARLARQGRRQRSPPNDLGRVLAQAQRGEALGESEIVGLFRARGDDFAAVCRAADELRRDVNGDVVSYVVTRNINYTNICSFKLPVLRLLQGQDERESARPALRSRDGRDRADASARRGRAARRKSACRAASTRPTPAQKYLEICRGGEGGRAARSTCTRSRRSKSSRARRRSAFRVIDFLRELKAAGLGTLPGTAAEILDDEVRAVLCADKIRTGAMARRDARRAPRRPAHRRRRSCSAISRATSIGRGICCASATLQSETGGFTEFVPLPFVHMEAPIYLKGRARPGPTFREAVLMHAVARLVLNPLIPNIQASWVKLGAGRRAALPRRRASTISAAR